MTTTPTIWKPEFFPNFQSLAGNQSTPQTIGLANGNILTVWVDDTFGTSPGKDIVGQLFDAYGNAFGLPFQVNSAVVGADETNPKIVAMPDGGYVMAYGSFLDSTGEFIVVQRYDSNGNSVFADEIVKNNANANSINNWTVTADSAGNYTVAFDLLSDDTFHTGSPNLSYNIHSITYNHATNARAAEDLSTALNDRDLPDNLKAVATFANGDMVTLSEGQSWDVTHDFSENTVDFTIINPTTQTVVRSSTRLAGEANLFSASTNAIPADVAVLTGGQIVMLYTFLPEGDTADSGLVFQIAAGESSNSAIGSRLLVYNTNFAVQAHVVALTDGGFFVAYAQNGVLFGQRYDVNGSPVGTLLPFATDVSDFSGRVSLTSDGRILIPYLNSSHEIAEVILDPRENIIHGTDAGETLTTQVGSTQLFGEGGDDTLLGLAGNDTLDGGPGADTLKGGPGDDTYILRDVHLINSNPFIFGYDTVVEAANQGIDTVRVQPLGGTFSLVSGYTLPANVENGIVEGSGDFSLTGNELANHLTGNSDANRLDGKTGNDMLTGGLGADTFVFAPTYNLDTVTDFTVADGDKIDLAGFTNIHSVTRALSFASQVGGDTVFDFGNGDKLTLSGVLKTNLNMTSFVLNLLPAAHDFNGDRTSDMLWQFKSSGGVYDFSMSNGQVTASPLVTTLPSSSWTFLGTGDFNGDGTSDQLWQYKATGGVYDFTMSNGQVTASPLVTTLPSTSWTYLASGDFNGDGTSDMLWQYNATGGVYDFTMSNGQFTGSPLVTTLPSSSWAFLGTGDFNGDGTSDSLFQYKATGGVYDFAMSNGQLTSSALVTTLPSSSWSYVGSGDFNGDGTSDMLWQYQPTGGIYDFTMSNGQVASSPLVTTLPGNVWTFLGTADFNGDGTSDFLMQYNATGGVYDFGMSNGQLTSSPLVTTLPASSWSHLA